MARGSIAHPAHGKKRPPAGPPSSPEKNQEMATANRTRYQGRMDELHGDALLGGSWSPDTDDDPAFEDREEQRRDEGRTSPLR